MNPVPLPVAEEPVAKPRDATCAGMTISFGNPPVSGQVWYNAATNELYIVPPAGPAAKKPRGKKVKS